MANVQSIIDSWFAENMPGINPANNTVLFHVSFKGCHDTRWKEYMGGRVTTLEEADRIASEDVRIFTLRKVDIGEIIISLWEMRESRETISCLYRNEELYKLFAGKDYSSIWR
jgi:hypothetical protein